MKTAHLKKKLEEEKAKLESEMSSVGQRNTGVPGDWESVPTETGTEPDMADQADVAISRDTNRALLSVLEAQYDEVLKALSRIETGSYGACEACGMHIEDARLEAHPSATTCTTHM
jgi:RNA polymerase-binding transcription factor DksA